MRDGRWDIDAKLPEGESPGRVPEMVLNLLVERFKLVSHHESRESQVYELIVDKGGPKLNEAVPEEQSAESNEPGKGAASSSFSLGGEFATGSMRMNNAGTGV